MIPWIYEWNNGLVEYVMGTSDIPPSESYLMLDTLDAKDLGLWDTVKKESDEPLPIKRVRVRFVRVTSVDAPEPYYREEGWID